MNVLRNANLQILLAIALVGPLGAQSRHCQPATDSAAQASPLNGASRPAIDASEQASPIGEPHRKSAKPMPARVPLHVTLTEAIDSGNLKNGQTIRAKLATAPAPRNAAHLSWKPATGARLSWKPGTPALITVVSTVPAGKLNAVGEMSLELYQVGGQHVDTDILTFRGEPGHRDLPDSAPSVGTNAGLASGTALTFRVQPSATAAEYAPTPGRLGPGTVSSVAPGSKPANYGQPTVPPVGGTSQQ